MTQGIVAFFDGIDRFRSSTPWTADHDKKATIPQTPQVAQPANLNPELEAGSRSTAAD
jgi:hypothetical protein